MKKYGIKGILGLIMELIAAVFLVLCIFTDWNDDIFLPLALLCVCIGNCLSLALQIENRKKAAKQNK